MLNLDDRLPSKTRRQLVHLLGAGTAAGLAGCIGGDDDDTSDDSDPSDDGTPVIPDEIPIQPEFITATESEATDLNHYQINDVHSGFRVGTVLDGAYTLDHNDDFYSLWVEDYENIGDEEYVFTLRDNLEFGAGYGQMTADDWSFHYHNVVYPAAAEGENWVAHASPGGWEEIAEFEVEDDLTFTLRLESPDPLFIQRPVMWGEYVYPADLIRPYYEDWQDGADDVANAITEDDDILDFSWTGNLGPYTFDYREPEDRWVAVRNDEYYRRGTDPDADDWENAPYFEQYTIRTIEEQSTRLAELETENLSGLTAASAVPPDEIEEVASWDHTQLYPSESPFVFLTTYNQRANGWEPFRNREIRRAFSMAINKETVVEDIYLGTAEIGHTYQPPWSEFYTDDVEKFGVGDTYDPEGARQIIENELDDHHYDGGDLIGPDGNQVELTLVHRARHAPEEDTGHFHAHQYEENLGISIEQDIVPATVFFEQYMDQEGDDGQLYPNAGHRDEYTSERDWDIMWSLGLNTYPRSPGSLSIFWGRDAFFNFMGWHPPEGVDIPGMVANTEPNLDDMRETYHEIYQILASEQPANFLVFTSDVTAYHESMVINEDPSPSFGYKGTTWWKETNPFE